MGTSGWVQAWAAGLEGRAERRSGRGYQHAGGLGALGVVRVLGWWGVVCMGGLCVVLLDSSSAEILHGHLVLGSLCGISPSWHLGVQVSRWLNGCWVLVAGFLAYRGLARWVQACWWLSSLGELCMLEFGIFLV